MLYLILYLTLQTLHLRGGGGRVSLFNEICNTYPIALKLHPLVEIFLLKNLLWYFFDELIMTSSKSINFYENSIFSLQKYKKWLEIQYYPLIVPVFPKIDHISRYEKKILKTGIKSGIQKNWIFFYLNRWNFIKLVFCKIFMSKSFLQQKLKYFM